MSDSFRPALRRDLTAAVNSSQPHDELGPAEQVGSAVWESREQFDAFGVHLMPVLKDVGIELSGEPEILEIHSILKR